MPNINLSNINSVEDLIAAVKEQMGSRESQPSYMQLSTNLRDLGFNPRVYFDGEFVSMTTNPDELVERRSPITILWLRDDGQQVIQCAKADGTTLLFWPGAAEDLQSQLADLAARFAKPAILGNEDEADRIAEQLVGRAGPTGGGGSGGTQQTGG